MAWGNLGNAKSANQRNYRLPDTVGRRIRRLDDETTSARASPDRRHKKPCLGIHGGSCHGFGAGAWAADLERQHLVPCARGRRDHAIGANPPTRQHTAPIRAGRLSGSEDGGPMNTILLIVLIILLFAGLPTCPSRTIPQDNLLPRRATVAPRRP